MITSGFFAAAIFVLTVIALSLLVFNYKNYKILALAIPLIIALAVSTFYTIEHIKGYPSKTVPSEKFVFLDYYTDGKTAIFVWYRKTDELYPKTFEIPYSKKAHQELNNAKEKKKQGKQVIGSPLKQEHRENPLPNFELNELNIRDFGFKKDN